VWTTRDEAFARYLNEGGWFGGLLERNVDVKVHITEGGGGEEEDTIALNEGGTNGEGEEGNAGCEDWAGRNFGCADGVKTWQWDADKGWLGNAVTGVIFATYVLLAYLVTFEFFVKYQDKHVVWTRIYAVIVITVMATVLGCILNSKAIQKGVWGTLGQLSRAGSRNRFRFRSSDEENLGPGGIEVEMGNVGKRTWGKLEGEDKVEEGEDGEEREKERVVFDSGRPSLRILRQLATSRNQEFGVFVCGPKGLIDDVRSMAAPKVVKCGGNKIINPQVVSNAFVYEEAFEW